MGYVYVKATCGVPLPSDPQTEVTLHAGKRFDAADELAVAYPDRFAATVKKAAAKKKTAAKKKGAVSGDS